MSEQIFSIKNATYPTIVYDSKPLVLSGLNSPILVFIPGNPGLVGYYVEYLSALQKKIPTFEILAISHAGFTYDDSENTNEVLGLQVQADHKTEIIKKFVVETREVYIFGHSVGCYIIQKMISKMMDDEDPILNQIKQFCFITPTISEIGLSKNGIILSKCFQYIPNFHILVSKLAYLTKLIPNFMLTRLLRWRLATNSEYSITETKRLIQSLNLILKSLGLAKEEMTTINSNHSLNDTFFRMLNEGSIKFWGFFCHTDYWVHNDTRKELIYRYQSQTTKFEIHDDMSIMHSFCLKSSEQFAEITEKAIAV